MADVAGGLFFGHMLYGDAVILGVIRMEEQPGALISTKDIAGSKVWMEKPKKKDPDATKKMGRVRACVFHPRDKRCVGFIVKRPDLALMFHRRDLFVAYNGYDRDEDGAIVVHGDPEATDKGACKALGIDWDECVLWVGLPVMCEDGTEFGLVGEVLYAAETGVVDSLVVTQGATANALLGRRRVPASLMRGFRRGMGAELAVSGEGEGDAHARGAILVDDAVKSIPEEGGVAEKAGEGVAKAGDAMRKAGKAAKPKVDEATAAAGAAVNKGAYATGRQIKRASGMFSEFKEEYEKALGKERDDAAVLGGARGQARVAAAAADAAAPTAAIDATDVTASAAIADTANDEDVEYMFLDEDGNEVVYVDEDGNVITDPALIDEDFEDVDDAVIEVGEVVLTAEPAIGDSAKPNRSSSQPDDVAQIAGRQLKRAGGMFAAFKEEYDKARHE